MNRPGKTMGMRHIALYTRDMEASEAFYVDLLGMAIEWRPDDDNVYLSSGNDNLALHSQSAQQIDETGQRLDHIGFFLPTMDSVDEWFAFFQQNGVRIRNEPRTHRDGARSFYCFDPDGVVVQMIYHPPIAEQG